MTEKSTQSNIPQIEPSNMQKAVSIAARLFDEWLEDIAKDYYGTMHIMGKKEYERHMSLHLDRYSLSYSQNSQALRIVDEERDLVITALYNVWSQEKEDFVDRVYCRKNGEEKTVGLGVLLAEYIIDGRISLPNEYYADKAVAYKSALTLEQQTVLGILPNRLGNIHSYEGSGITCVHQNRCLTDDPDSWYIGYYDRDHYDIYVNRVVTFERNGSSTIIKEEFL